MSLSRSKNSKKTSSSSAVEGTELQGLLSGKLNLNLLNSEDEPDTNPNSITLTYEGKSESALRNKAETEKKLQKYNVKIARLRTELDAAQSRQDNLDKAKNANTLGKKFNRWLRLDTAAGFLAAAGLTSLYGFVEKIRFYLPPHIINFIFPVMVLADTLGTIAAWKEFQIGRMMEGGKIKGARNKLLRAILETVCALGGATIIVGAIVTTAVCSQAIAGAFAAFIAPTFMALLAARTLFSGVSGVFHHLRAIRREKRALNATEEDAKILRDQANHYRGLAKIQLASAGTTAIGFVATTVVMLLHHFGMAYIGIAGGVALGGFMTYLSIKTHQGRKAVNKEAEQLEKDEIDLPQQIGDLTQKINAKTTKMTGRMQTVKGELEKQTVIDKGMADEIARQVAAKETELQRIFEAREDNLHSVIQLKHEQKQLRKAEKAKAAQPTQASHVGDTSLSYSQEIADLSAQMKARTAEMQEVNADLIKQLRTSTQKSDGSPLNLSDSKITLLAGSQTNKPENDAQSSAQLRKRRSSH